MNSNKLVILNQKYIVAKELRTLASIQYGRDSKQFLKADAKCLEALAKYEAYKAS